MMIGNNTPPQDNEDKESFATNWYERIDSTFQLIVSDYIYQIYGSVDKQVQVQRIVKSDTRGLLYDPQAEQIIATFIFNPKEAEWTINAKERYQRGSESSSPDTF